MRLHVATCPDFLIASVIVQELISAGYPATLITPLGAAYILPGPVRVFLENDDWLNETEDLANIESILGSFALREVFDETWAKRL
ncbi:MAG TPA: hypothetical protein PLO61_11245 [Fimbriimonadaceae bacterium]|nr:hypothetical protein [Fimbriimonadaceae bacterium]HRJ34194.1 hypothetical protein [Fimbriimonadaceae bacterium]